MSLWNVFHVSFPGLGIKDLTIDRVAFQFKLGEQTVAIYWYGILFAIGFLLCLILMLRHSHYYNLSNDEILDSFLTIMVFSIVGARLYYVAFSWDLFKDNPMRIFSTRDGGLAFYGGVIGGIFGLWLIGRIRKIPFNRLVEYYVCYLPLGQGIGRWGNFFNQEAFGTNTTLPWGMFSEGTMLYMSRLGAPHDPMLPVHPTFLYEFLGNMVIFGILLYVRRFVKKGRSYMLFATYLLTYGALRFVVEGLRTDSLYIGNTDIRVSQALSAVMVIAAIVYLIYLKVKGPKPEPTLAAEFVPLEDLELKPGRAAVKRG